MEQPERCCLNCKHYVKHYIFRHTKFKYINCGHCVNDKSFPRRKQLKYELDDKCDLWESNEEREKERDETIKSVLKDMRKHLSEIAQILKDD